MAVRWDQRTLGGVLLALTLVSILLGVKTAISREDDVTCLRNYIAENSRVQKIRAEAALEQQAATETLLGGVTTLVSVPAKDPKKGAAQFRSLFTNYQKTTAAVAAKRAANPLPPFPGSCSDVFRK